MTSNDLTAAAGTVRAYVDPHARRLVDAINTSPLAARTIGCCSGHYHKPGLPYAAFWCRGWDLIHVLLTCVSALNHVTGAQTSISLRSRNEEGEIRASLKLSVYPWQLPGFNFGPLLAEDVTPPRSLARLWWRELEELAAMIEERRMCPSGEFVAFFGEQRRASHEGRRRPVPAWARLP